MKFHLLRTLVLLACVGWIRAASAAQPEPTTSATVPATSSGRWASSVVRTPRPTLMTPDGLALYDSPVICEYLDSVGSAPKLFPAVGPARWKALQLQALGWAQAATCL